MEQLSTIPPSGEGSNAPLVTSLCLTRNRRRWLPRAINCWQQQTYANRELLILADGDPVDDLVPKHDSRIRLVVLRDILNIGSKRNLGTSHARGKIIASWDDDDWSAPNRLLDEVGRLFETNTMVTGYHTMKFTDGGHWWLYQGTSNFAFGTSLCYFKQWAVDHPFPAKQVSEDNMFVHEALMEHVFVSRPAVGQKPKVGIEQSDLMYATVHSGNTSPRKIIPQSNWIPLN